MSRDFVSEDTMADLHLNAFAVDAAAAWTSAIRFANRLVRGGHRVLLVTGVTEDDGGAPPPGSFVIPLTSAWDPGVTEPVEPATVRAEAASAGIDLVPLSTSSGLLVAPLAAVRVGLYGGGGAPFNHAAVLAECGFALRFLSDTEIRGGALATVDVLVMPGGGFRAMHGQIEPLGEEGCRAIADFVRHGGMYIGCCAGSYDCIVNSESFVGSCPAQRHLQLVNAGPWRGEEAVEFLDLQSPGVGVVTVTNERPNHPVMFGMPPSFEISHYNGPVLNPLAEPAVEGASAVAGLAAFSGWTPRFTPAEAFAGPPESDKPTYLGQAIAAGRFSIVAGELGTGRVVAFGSHPEFGLDLPMHEWSTPARMLANAVLWQAMARRSPAASWGYSHAPGSIGVPRGVSLTAVKRAAAEVVDRAQTLRMQSIEPRPQWLTPNYAMSVFGYPPDEIWCRSLDDIMSLADQTTRLVTDLGDTLANLGDGPLPEPLLDAVMHVERWILDERPAEWRQDGGYQGVLALLRTAARMCDEALARWDVILGPPAGPYGYVDTNPYHLVAGSYLAAIGCVVGALQLIRALVAEVELARQLAGREAERGLVGVGSARSFQG